MNPVLRITDGETIVNLFENATRGAGFFLLDWTPQASPLQDGGVWNQTPFGGGRQLVQYQFGNTLENLELGVNGADQDAVILDTQKLRRLLVKALDYWAAEWQDQPVWIEIRGKSETNIRYGLLKGFEAPGDDNPFATPFADFAPVAIEDFPLLLEHAPWQDVPPGESTCVPAAGTGTYTHKATYKPTDGADNVYTTTPNLIALNQTGIRFGKVGASSLKAGVRFRNVDIPQGATIASAVLRLVASASQAGVTVNATIIGEDADDANTFSTYVNFQARPRTTATVAWNNVPAWTSGDVIVTADLSPIIQEIVDRAGWAENNNLVLFIEDNGSSNGAERTFAGLAHATLAEAELQVVIEAQTIGRTATCENEVYAANKQTRGNLTDIFYYDASAGTFSANLMAGPPPYALFPAVPAAGDILYFLIDFTFAGYAEYFCSLVFDIQTAHADITGMAYEYWNGAAWTALPTVRDNTSLAGTPIAFAVTGVNSIHWTQPADFGAPTVNGVTGVAVRLRITSVGANPTPPVQQNRPPYTVTWPQIGVEAAQVGGDIPALARYKIFVQSGSTAVGYEDVRSQRLVTGLRKRSRGSGFAAFMNWTNRDNPDGITAGDVLGTTVGDARAPNGAAVRYNTPGPDPIRDVAVIQISNSISNHFYGRFRAFVRLTVDAGSAGTFAVQLEYGRLTSPLVYVNYVDEFLTLDMGQIQIPGTRQMSSSDKFDSFMFTVMILNEGAGALDVKFYDLILIPIDEWGGDFITTEIASNVLALTVSSYLDIDSIKYAKAAPVRALQRIAADEDVKSGYQAITPQPAILQANADQDLYLLSLTFDSSLEKQQAFPYTAYKIQVEKLQRYLSMRGAQ